MHYDTILLMVPTYKRHISLLRFIQSALRQADDPSRVRFCLCVNEKDQSTRDFVRMLYFPHVKQCEVILEDTDQPNLPLYFNKMYRETIFTDAVVSMVGDDMEFATQGWDVAILSAINASEGKSIVYCDDDYIAHDKLCVNMFTTREVVEATRKPFMCERYHADMIDVVWMSVGLKTGLLRYLPEVKIKHLHQSARRTEDQDETYRRMIPVRQAANSQDLKKYAEAYATVCAANLIDAGIGQWNTI